MTNQTAQNIFTALLLEIRSHDLTDIGGFMLEEMKHGEEFESFTQAYEYQDNITILDETAREARDPNQTFVALFRLLDASISYFLYASQLPLRFTQQMTELTGEENQMDIMVDTVDGRHENLSKRLESSEVEKLLTLLTTIRENIDQDDDTLFQVINQL